jgi:hypothetical protein
MADEPKITILDVDGNPHDWIARRDSGLDLKDGTWRFSDHKGTYVVTKAAADAAFKAEPGEPQTKKDGYRGKLLRSQANR